MMTTLSAYKEMIPTSFGGKTDQTLRKVMGDKVADAVSTELSAAKSVDAVSVELSASHDVFSAVDSYFNMGRSGRFDAFHKLSREDKEQFVQIVAELAKSGYVGYEELIVNKKIERHEILTQIGDDRLHDAKVYDRPKDPYR